MSRSFKMMLSESEKDYTYFLLSPYNIMTPEMLDKISIGMHGRDLVDVEPVGQLVNTDTFNPYFPDLKSEGTYKIKLITAYPINIHRTKIQLAQYLHYDPSWLILHEEGEEILRDTCDCDAVEEPSDDNQELVGVRRLDAFMSELSKEREEIKEAERAKNIHTGDLCVNHATLQEMVGRRVRRGYYVLETYKNGRVLSYGPYQSAPINTKLVETVDAPTNTHRHMTESGIVYEFSDEDSKGQLPNGKVYVVPVINDDTGAEYDVKVKANSPERARDAAVVRASRVLKVPKITLSATMPE